MLAIVGVGRQAALAFIVVTVVFEIVAMGIVIPVLPPLIEEFAGSNSQAGWINGVFVALWAGVQFVCSPIIGSISDRYGRRPVILLSAAGLAANYMVIALAPNLWWLAVGRIIAGIAASSFTTVFAYMADITPLAGRARAYGLIGAALSGGLVFGPVLGGFLGEISPRAPFWFAAGLSGLAFLYGLFILPESLAPEKRMVFSWKRANPFGALQLLRSHHELFGFAAVNFLLHFSYYAFSAVFVLYAGDRYGWGPWEVGLVLALVGALDMSVQGLLVGPLVKRFGDRTVTVLFLLGGAVGIACMGLAPTGWLFAAALVPAAFWGPAMPTLQSLMTRLVSDSEQGQLQGANMSLASIAGVASPLFFGAVYAATVQPTTFAPFPGLSFLIAALVLLIGGGFCWMVARRTADAAARAVA